MENHKLFEKSELYCSETSVCVMGENVWVNAVHTGQQSVNQEYNTF